MIMGLTSSCHWAPLTPLLVNAHTVRPLVLQVQHLADFIPSYLRFVCNGHLNLLLLFFADKGEM